MIKSGNKNIFANHFHRRVVIYSNSNIGTFCFRRGTEGNYGTPTLLAPGLEWGGGVAPPGCMKDVVNARIRRQEVERGEVSFY